MMPVLTSKIEARNLSESGEIDFKSEARRIRSVYQDREVIGADRVHDRLTAYGNWAHRQVERHLAWALAKKFQSQRELEDLKILDVGCGTGEYLMWFASLGIPFTNLFGIDLLDWKIAESAKRFPGITLVCGDASSTGWPAAHFDVIYMVTCLDSILDTRIRKAVANEISRLLKPEGLIVSLHFTWNPLNKATVGIDKDELARLFPAHFIRSKRVILAPPLSRLLLRLGEPIVAILGSIPFLCFHRIAYIHKLLPNA